jgi:pyruvate/2-oxoglutarate dehydrogenase complex dihydrolipoamide dehydrogenase (E3) component
MRRGNFDAVNALETVTVVTGRAMFVDPHTVSVETGGQCLTIRGETIVVDVGAQPIVPDIPGLRASKHVVTSTELMESTVLPERLVIIGGGPLGLEFAGIYRHFGSQITVLDAAPRILGDQDEDVAAAVEAILVGDGIELIAGVHVLQVHDRMGAATIVYEKDGRRHSVDADAILAAAGRAPAVRDVGLEAACVRMTEHGAIEVDECLRTSQPHIYAVGDGNGHLQHSYISLDDGRIVLDQVAGGGHRSTTDRVVVPHTIFTTPPLATVGVTEKAGEPGDRGCERLGRHPGRLRPRPLAAAEQLGELDRLLRAGRLRAAHARLARRPGHG